MKRLFLVTLLTFCLGTTFSQTSDSLSVFPNPFSDSTTIHFEIAQSHTITLRVFTPLGQIMETFFDAVVLPSGSYNINLLGDSLADGIYYVILDIGSTKNIVKSAVKKGTTASIEKNKAFDKVLVYPNPTDDLITIPVTGNKKIMITDLNGKTLKSFTTDQQVISLLNLAAGQYIITVLTNENEIIASQKIQKSE